MNDKKQVQEILKMLQKRPNLGLFFNFSMFLVFCQLQPYRFILFMLNPFKLKNAILALNFDDFIFIIKFFGVGCQISLKIALIYTIFQYLVFIFLKLIFAILRLIFRTFNKNKNN